MTLYARFIMYGEINGAAGYKQHTASWFPPCDEIHSMACRITGIVGVTSSASSAGRRNGTSAPFCLEISAISSLSVETMIRSKTFDSIAAKIVQTIMGFPRNSLMFFLGSLLLPLRAGITANVTAYGLYHLQHGG